mmetsp:Transcript_7616/g.22807  ORF Transcript_7616/g.22807 Transcript_7616/m.22807 type:complete len:495 (+) Transcript_7616:899-2383(+)
MAPCCPARSFPSGRASGPKTRRTCGSGRPTGWSSAPWTARTAWSALSWDGSRSGSMRGSLRSSGSSSHTFKGRGGSSRNWIRTAWQGSRERSSSARRSRRPRARRPKARRPRARRPRRTECCIIKSKGAVLSRLLRETWVGRVRPQQDRREDSQGKEYGWMNHYKEATLALSCLLHRAVPRLDLLEAVLELKHELLKVVPSHLGQPGELAPELVELALGHVPAVLCVHKLVQVHLHAVVQELQAVLCIPLQELEELLHVPRLLLVKVVVSVRVRPHQGLPALDDLLAGLRDKGQLAHRGPCVRADLCKQVFQTTEPVEGLPGLGAARLVRVPPLKVVHVPLQRGPREVPPLPVGPPALVFGLVLVAAVEPPRPLPVLAPRAQAQPAELVLAHRAGHVHAPVVLLDGALALGARLGVGEDPVQVLGLRAVLDDPLLPHRAGGRAVGLLPACKAEEVPAVAPHVERRVARGAVETLENHGAARRSAPLQLPAFLHK